MTADEKAVKIKFYNTVSEYEYELMVDSSSVTHRTQEDSECEIRRPSSPSSVSVSDGSMYEGLLM